MKTMNLDNLAAQLVEETGCTMDQARVSLRIGMMALADAMNKPELADAYQKELQTDGVLHDLLKDKVGFWKYFCSFHDSRPLGANDTLKDIDRISGEFARAYHDVHNNMDYVDWNRVGKTLTERYLEHCRNN